MFLWEAVDSESCRYPSTARRFNSFLHCSAPSHPCFGSQCLSVSQGRNAECNHPLFKVFSDWSVASRDCFYGELEGCGHSFLSSSGTLSCVDIWGWSFKLNVTFLIWLKSRNVYFCFIADASNSYFVTTSSGLVCHHEPLEGHPSPPCLSWCSHQSRTLQLWRGLKQICFEGLTRAYRALSC